MSSLRPPFLVQDLVATPRSIDRRASLLRCRRNSFSDGEHGAADGDLFVGDDIGLVGDEQDLPTIELLVSMSSSPASTFFNDIVPAAAAATAALRRLHPFRSARHQWPRSDVRSSICASRRLAAASAALPSSSSISSFDGPGPPPLLSVLQIPAGISSPESPIPMPLDEAAAPAPFSGTRGETIAALDGFSACDNDD